MAVAPYIPRERADWETLLRDFLARKPLPDPPKTPRSHVLVVKQ